MIDFGIAKRLFTSAEARLAAIRAELQQMQARREAVRHAAVSREDLKGLVAVWIAGNCSRFPEQVQQIVGRLATNPHALSKSDELKRLVTFGSGSQFGEDPTDLSQILSALLGPAMLSAVSAAVDSMDSWPETALTAAQREKELTVLDNKIEKLLHEEREIVDRAREAGLNLE